MLHSFSLGIIEMIFPISLRYIKVNHLNSGVKTINRQINLWFYTFLEDKFISDTLERNRLFNGKCFKGHRVIT